LVDTKADGVDKRLLLIHSTVMNCNPRHMNHRNTVPWKFRHQSAGWLTVLL